jgi:hypothetical protein
MGYGGIFKSVAKIAVTYIGFSLGGPLGAAVASAAFTGATGGSFKEALISGATSYVGAKISMGLSDYSATATALEPFGGAGDVLGSVGPDASLAGNIGELVNTAGAAIDPVTSFISESAAGSPISGITQFLGDTVFDPLAGATSTAFNIFDSIDDLLLGDLLPDFVASSLVEGGAGIVAGAVGGLAALTMEQALNAQIPGLDEALVSEAGFTPQGVQALRNEARNAQSQAAFEGLLETVDNPFLRGGQDADQLQAAQDEFAKVLAAGVERENVRLGPEVTQQQFSDVFDQPDLGSTILRSEEDLRKQAFNQQIGQTFPGDVFQSLDDDIISSIVQERQGPAQEQISRFGARGNLNPTGGKTANLFIEEQVPEARERVTELGSGVLGQNIRDISDIRSQASEQVRQFQLGDEPFDVAPFAEQRKGLVEERQGTLGEDVRSAIGGEPLFDVTGALRAGGRAQGVVSGRGQNQSFLDQIAARELGSTRNINRRGLGSRGSGAF